MRVNYSLSSSFTHSKMKVFNRKAKFNYRLIEKYEAGIVLTGDEVKAIKRGKVDIGKAYVKAIRNELYLINANFNKPGDTGSRKLLLHKKEIISLLTEIKAKRLTLIPTKMYTRGRLIKLEFALAKSKRGYEKRDLIKRKDIERDIERELKDI